MCSTSSSSNDVLSSENKPKLILIHGFGGSLDQLTSLARNLTKHFDIYAIDSIGFGQSEKPPLSYNQYLWRDQIVEFVERISSNNKNNRIILAGNSIGGFTAGSAAASLYERGLCAGLILFNSAGKIIENTGLLNTPEELLFPSYKGPPPEFLRIFGRTIFSLLQPRIAKTCEWLYPTNTIPVKTYLAKNIYRDSCDPGGSDVIAAGGNNQLI
jgi:pimeloyl-ACP methyl ester carboxylesterase